MMEFETKAVSLADTLILIYSEYRNTADGHANNKYEVRFGAPRLPLCLRFTMLESALIHLRNTRALRKFARWGTRGVYL